MCGGGATCSNFRLFQISSSTIIAERSNFEEGSIDGYEEERKTQERNVERGLETDGNESSEEDRMKETSCVVVDSDTEEGKRTN